MKLQITLLSIVLGLLTSGVFAEEPKKELTVDQIVTQANHMAYYQAADGKSKVTMVITDKQGRERNREFNILRKNVGDTDGDQMYYVYFLAPSDVRKMVFMVHKHADVSTEDDRWLYLPSLDLVKRIASGDKRTSFVGSDFLYEDVSGRGIDEDTHELTETTDGQYVVNNVPKDPASVEFQSYKVWIDKDTFLPRKAEYLDKNGKLYRRILSGKIETIQGHPTATEQTAEDVARGTSTVITFGAIKYDTDLNDSIFTERFLRRPPREVTQ
jgi:outer membrane lipoprotein-sorting protein